MTFILAPSDAMLRALYARALAYVFPAVEDFGIMPVEAMACGTPIIANSVGGVRETIEAVGGGVMCDIERWNDWDEVLHQATSLDADAFRQRTQMFSRARFIGELRDWVSRGVGGAAGQAAWALAFSVTVAVTRIGRWSLRPCGSVRTLSIVKPTEVAKS